MDEKVSVVFRYISGTTYTHEDLNKICLNYESDIESRVIAQQRIFYENKLRKEKSKIESDKRKFFNQVLEHFETIFLEAKDNMYETKIAKSPVRNKIRFNRKRKTGK